MAICKNNTVSLYTVVYCSLFVHSVEILYSVYNSFLLEVGHKISSIYRTMQPMRLDYNACTRRLLLTWSSNLYLGHELAETENNRQVDNRCSIPETLNFIDCIQKSIKYCLQCSIFTLKSTNRSEESFNFKT